MKCEARTWSAKRGHEVRRYIGAVSDSTLTSNMGENPFVPGFGLSPHLLVGRNRLIADIEAGLRAGPRDQRFTSLLTGVRGSGKTVTLEAIQDSMEAQGWFVLQTDATSSGLPVRIIESIQEAKKKYVSAASADDRRRTTRVSGISAAGFGINWAEVGDSGVPASGSAMSHLSALATSALAAGTSILLSIDELQGVDREEFRRLAADIQHITSRNQLPLALVAAGLPQIKSTLLSDKKMTFLQRCHKMEVPPISTADALEGLNVTIRDAGGSIEQEALRIAAEDVRGSPYRLQLIGYNAWKISGAPSRSISVVATKEALLIADDAVTENISIPAWYDLDDPSQSFLESLVCAGGAATIRDIATSVGMSSRHAQRIGRVLTLSGYVEKTEDGRIILSDLVPEHVVQGESALMTDDSPGESAQHFPKATRRNTRCGQYMPRADTVCVLSHGHKGAHRSRV